MAKTPNQRVAALKANDARRLVLAVQETLWPVNDDTPWSPDTMDEITAIFKRFGLGPVNEEEANG